MPYYLGVDVGTASIRVALVNEHGEIKRTAEKSLKINNPRVDFYEQSSTEIWLTCCELIKDVTKDVPSIEIHGIGFDATCSLVVLSEDFSPVAVNDNYKNGHCFDVIMWMDHRAKKQADYINSISHDVLKYIGGKMSLEMQPPKLLWLKQNLPQQWSKASHFFDLSDFLTYKATSCLTRSSCSTTCKWTYSVKNEWSEDFWRNIGLCEITQNDFFSIGNCIVEPGSPLGRGLTEEAAQEMNLDRGIAVGAGLVDAHCGGVGTIACDVSGLQVPCVGKPITERIAFICGTSSCHMALSEKPLFVPGVWGPYYSAMIPNLWLNEGGQSATGSVIDHVIQSHPAYKELQDMANSRKENIYQCLNNVVDDVFELSGEKSVDFLTRNLHVGPDYHGNRSPLADHALSGAICGLNLDQSLQDLARKYLATIQALASGSRYIVDTLVENGHHISTVFMCGGLSKNPLFIQIHANVLKLPIVLGKETEAVLLGAAILGACASKEFPSLQVAMKSMCKPGKVIQPILELIPFYEKKHKVFLEMIKHQLQYRSIMEE